MDDQQAERLISEIREGAFAQGTANLIAYAELHFKVLGYAEPDLMTTIRDQVGLPPKEAV